MYSTKNKKEVQDVDAFIQDAKERHNLSVDTFATISGIRGKQFNREIFTSVIKFKDLIDFLAVFPDVQRDVIKRRVGTIKNYVLSGLEDDSALRFFSAITVTTRGHVFYDEANQRIAINSHESKMSINDGQHRFFGINEAIKELKNRADNGRDKFSRSQARSYLEQLEEMVIPLVIFNQISETEEKQLFHDLNQLAQRPSRSATIKLVQTDLYSKVAREVAKENRYLKHVGVEMDKSSIHPNNPNVVLLTTLYQCTKLLYWKHYKQDSKFLNKANFEVYKQEVDDTFTKIFQSLPHDVTVKRKYLIEKNYTLKGICKFIHECRFNIGLDDDIIFNAIKETDWTPNIAYWSKYGALESASGNILFSGGNGGIYGVFEGLMSNIRFNHKDLIEQLEEAKKEASASAE